MPESTNTKKAAAAIALLILSVALRPPIVSIGPVLDSIQRSFSLSYTQASLLIAIPDICMGVFALVAPGVARRFGTDNAVVAALVLLCVAMIARALAGSAAVLLVCTVFAGMLDNTHTPAETNAWSVFMLFVGYLVAALGPLSFGFLRDRTDGYFASYLMLFLAAVAITSMVPLLRPLSQSGSNSMPAMSGPR
jgi:cyanate permease